MIQPRGKRSSSQPAVTTNRSVAKKPKKSKSDSKKTRKTSFWKTITSERAVQVYGILLIALSILLLISAFSYFFTQNPTDNVIGYFGYYLAKSFVDYTFGIFAIGFSPLFFMLGVKMTFGKTMLPLVKTFLSILLCMAWLSLFCAYIFTVNSYKLSGAFGFHINEMLKLSLDTFGTFILLAVFLATILILCFNVSFKRKFKEKSPEPLKKEELGEKKSDERPQPHIIVEEKMIDEDRIIPRITVEKTSKPEPEEEFPPIIIERLNYDETTQTVIDEDEQDRLRLERFKINFPVSETETTHTPKSDIPEKSDEVLFEIIDHSFQSEDDTEETEPEEDSFTVEPTSHTLERYDPRSELSYYEFPTIDLLNSYDSAAVSDHVKREELTLNKERIERALKSFGIEISKIFATIGPTVTLYEIVPVEGVRISKIKNLEDDIALSLAALGIRIIAPIPGKGTIGIEVPNSNPDIVPMRAILSSDKFNNAKFDLPIGLGKTISNEPFVADLTKMPHLLMAGATGQGKSVGLNAVMTSLLYKKHPAELKFILVDPKKVELTLYSLIEKYYLAKLPDAEDAIITDTKKVVRTLNSLCIEMDNRYDLLKQAQVRNIKEYNAKFCDRKLLPTKGHRYLPYIVLIIDEFADLIMTAGREVETPIARLAQLARAIGIHLIIATQRPSVNIITGIIKANFPARLAFRVTSKIDSRTILDMQGAEQLIGRGDMLLSNGSELTRIQCAFVDTPEVENVCRFISEQQSFTDAFLLPEYSGEENDGFDDSNFSDEMDPKLVEAAQLIVQIQQGSTSTIQRRMKLGYNRAGRIMDQLEDLGVVGASQGSKAREMKVKTMEELNTLLKSKGLI